MRGVLHAEVFGFNFSADINPCQRSDDCVIAAGQITERPRDVKTVWRRSVPLLSTENCSAERVVTPCTALQKQVLASLMQFLGLCVASRVGRFVPVQVGSHTKAQHPTVVRHL